MTGSPKPNASNCNNLVVATAWGSGFLSGPCGFLKKKTFRGLSPDWLTFLHTAAMSLEGGINAIVIGGSIGGLSCAHALLHAGCRVQVFERSSRISPAGAVRSHMLSTATKCNEDALGMQQVMKQTFLARTPPTAQLFMMMTLYAFTKHNRQWCLMWGTVDGRDPGMVGLSRCLSCGFEV